MNSIAITGVSGFVGKNLIQYLSRLNLKVLPINRTQLQQINEIDFNTCSSIVHLAGKAHDLKKTVNSAEYYEVNFELTKRLYDAFVNSSATKFIFVSSVKASADVVDGILTERDKPDPQTHYGKSKLMAEQYIKSKLLPQGKSYYILRPCMIHGPGNKGNLNLLYKFVQKGIPYPLAAFHNKRSFLSVENLCFVIGKLLLKDVFSGVYNVADDEALSTSEVVTILSASLNKNPKLWAIPATFVKLLASIGTAFRLPLSRERLTKLTENYVVSNDKITFAIDAKLPVATRTGLSTTAQSFK